MAAFYYRLWQTLLHILSSFSFTLCKVVGICVQPYVQTQQCCKNNFKIF